MFSSSAVGVDWPMASEELGEASYHAWQVPAGGCHSFPLGGIGSARGRSSGLFANTKYMYESLVATRRHRPGAVLSNSTISFPRRLISRSTSFRKLADESGHVALKPNISPTMSMMHANWQRLPGEPSRCLMDLSSVCAADPGKCVSPSGHDRPGHPPTLSGQRSESPPYLKQAKPHLATELKRASLSSPPPQPWCVQSRRDATLQAQPVFDVSLLETHGPPPPASRQAARTPVPERT